MEFIDNKFTKDFRNISSAEALTSENAFAADSPNMVHARENLHRIPDPETRRMAESALANEDSHVKYVAGSGGRATGITKGAAKKKLEFFKPGNRALMRAELRQATKEGNASRIKLLKKSLALFAAIDAGISLFEACEKARQEGLEAGVAQFVEDQSVMVEVVTLLEEGQREGTKKYREYLAEFQAEAKLVKIKKSYGYKKWLSELSAPDLKSAMETEGLTEEEIDADWLQEAMHKGWLR
jgi:hypothetical protein